MLKMISTVYQLLEIMNNFKVRRQVACIFYWRLGIYGLWSSTQKTEKCTFS
jgi:hypothetical protein